ncbi:MAG TPA: response regulator transcription factor [Terriglobales bacterium]|nr:response regulator transcription factor [Terriglobales bacterium]
MLKVILADNQAIFRAGAAKVLAVEDDLRIVAQAQNAEQVAMSIDRFRASVLIISETLAENLSKIVADARKQKTQVVIVSDKPDNTADLVRTGAAGIVFRSITGAALVECIRKVSKGENFVQDTAVAKEVEESDQVGARVRDRLTPKELKIVALVVQGYKNKEIASRLGTTEQVIKNYLRNVYDKIGVGDRLELALFTIHHRILAEAAAATTAGGSSK